MNAKQLLHHFDQIADAPDAVARLRQFIVDLAILGKLVPYHSNDENTTNLLARIEVEKQRLLNKGAINRSKPQAPISVEEIPILGSSPAIFVRLKEIAQIIKGAMGIQKANPGEYPLVTLAEKYASCDCYQFDTKAAIIPLISSTGHGHASMKRLHYQEGKFALGNILCAVIPYAPQIVSARFLYEYFCAYKELLFVSKMSGTANVSLTIGAIGEVPVPLISFNAQNRVDELMALCDELEAARVQRETRRDQLVAATLNSLTNGDTVSDHAERARFYFNHLPRLTTRPEHIKQLRQTILNLAVRGKLVPQDLNDEPASKLMKRIENEKLGRSSQRKLPKPQRLPPLNVDNLPFEISANWTWCRLTELSLKIHYGYTASANPSLKDVRLLRITDIQNNKVHWESVPGCDIADEQVDQYLLADGDILIARTGGTVGKSFLVKDLPVRAVFASYLIRIQGSSELFDCYLKLFLESPIYWKQLDDGSRGTGQPNVNGQTLGNMVVPLPPLAEQQRIVAKVDKLLALCDALEAQLTNNADTRRQLLEATLYTALAGQHEAEISL